MPQPIRLLTTVLCLGVTLLLGGTARAQGGVGAGHCVLALGTLSYSPALTLATQNTTVTVRGVGTGCVDVNVASGEEVLEVSWVEIDGSLTGTGSTLLSSYYGTVTTTFHFGDGSSETSVVEGTCILGVVGICPILGTVISGVDQGTLAEFTFKVLNLNILGPVHSLNFVDLATTMIKLTKKP
ncbi:hypothetical protein ACN469_00035 [Corallococcus terminator]